MLKTELSFGAGFVFADESAEPFFDAVDEGRAAERTARAGVSAETHAFGLLQEIQGSHDWLIKQHAAVLPKSPIGEAVGYALNHWTALTRYLDNGDLDIDNNTAEQALRGIAIGRKN